MWDEFTDHPMRRDYVDPDDYEYEPCSHDEVLARAKAQKDRELGIREQGPGELGIIGWR